MRWIGLLPPDERVLRFRPVSSGPLLRMRFLGELALFHGAQPVALPQSKKTRALLAYLALSGRPQRRERLCALLWDVTDDPRGALRWSLSKLRPLVDEEGCTRLVADREHVRFDRHHADVDVLTLGEAVAGGIERLETARLRALAATFHGELLEGLDLPDFHEYQAFCVAERARARTWMTSVLRALIDRLAETPDEAVPYARVLCQIDPLDEGARVTLTSLLERQRAPVVAAAPPTIATGSSDARPPLVGREEECARLRALADGVMADRSARVVLLSGEPGVGKSRLLSELVDRVAGQGGTVLDARSYEVEANRPYGPWIDALRRVPAVAVGRTLGDELSPLLPELGASAHSGERSRERLFGAVADLIAARAHSAPPVLLAFDDVQWCDEASAELLHYVARLSRHRPVLVALTARAGELADNQPVLRTLRALRRDQALVELVIGPLGRDATNALVAQVSPALDAGKVYEASAGNPLFALELARAGRPASGEVPGTVRELVRERTDRLPSGAREVLRWGAVLGRAFGPARLAGLVALSADELANAFEDLERHALLRPLDGVQHVFVHDVVREVILAELSSVRRNLMHARIAAALEPALATDESVAAELAHHAGSSGDAALAARACLAAGRRCLRVFANAQAEAFVRRGKRHAEGLPEPERTRRLLELTEVALSARRPSDLGEAAREIEALAERALDGGSLEHARLGFHMLSYLRWERGDWSDAERQTLRAELVSRAGEGAERVVALAEAARCLALLERDLARAEALLLEAKALAARHGVEPIAIPDAVGMLRWHQGALDEASTLFSEAQTLARREGDRTSEYRALEHRVVLELERSRVDEALRLAEELVALADKLREGSEAPFARALLALAQIASGPLGRQDGAADEALARACAELRDADAKHRLACALIHAGTMDLTRGLADRAFARAEEALGLALRVARPSEITLARVLAVRAARALGREVLGDPHLVALEREPRKHVSSYARAAAEAVLGATPTNRRTT